ncbi:hypothetical protein [Shimia sagamensis]|uniref:Uncharacterized protein n=1 Tax=Shimia sagamensis TaxID=1566352 RepID=A0ABY1P4W7_9RHOB|nr:hypothetical protein [Shimia sagamensis]SMP26502.1 hypothetical protein SAMN06265373_105256 [Shimia sagamensis]
MNAGETYTTKVATKSLGGTSSEMTGNMCPVSQRNEVKADGTLKCAFSNSIDLVKSQMSEELQKIHSVLLKFAVVSR